jgi:riboflavin kinase/FMN adenylyltransferase
MAIAVLHSSGEWLEKFGEERQGTVVAIGNFDGMHCGHQELLGRVTKEARSAGLIPAVLTFDPHPARVLRPEHAPLLLQTLTQRIAAFEVVGIEAVLVMRFDSALAQMSAEDFGHEVLAKTMRAKVVVVGDSFRFGHKQAGDVKFLEECGRHWGFRVAIAKPLMQEGAVISSSAIRSAVQEGRMDDAEKMLGRPFSLAGQIQTGTGLGRKVVVPTLNLKTEQELLPKRGVYATETFVAGRAFKSVTNVGMRPTFDGLKLTIETHLFDFDEMLTSGPMEIRFVKRLRDEQKFSGPEALKAQILKDIEQAKEYFLLAK